MVFSYSRIGTFNQCPYKFKLKYVDELLTYPNLEDPANALILGTALHKGIETDIPTAINEYYNSFPIVSDMHYIEALKLEYRLKQCKDILPEGLHEQKVMTDHLGTGFLGFLDLIVPVEVDADGIEWFDLYDFKYSNNTDKYLESEQLHVYKYYFEYANEKKRIRNMYFLFVPKVQIRQKKTETLDEFRARVYSKLQEDEPKIIQVEYDIQKVKNFLMDTKNCLMATNYPKQPSRLCDWCEYQKFCESEEREDLDIMNLPKNERVASNTTTNRKIWMYGLPFSGKTYLANQFPDMLLLSTDGNYKQLPNGIPPHIDLKDIVTVEGRITKRTLAWEVFKETIEELEKKQNDFKTIVVDLLEDTYEHCRLYCYGKLGIEHESDNSFKAWDYVKTEFLSTIKRLMALDYENIVLISHEDTSKDFTKKSGDKITAIKPNLQEKASLKVAGMVDVVIRIVNDDGDRKIMFKSNEVTFGGGRMTVDKTEIPCTYEHLIDVYKSAKPSDTKGRAEVKKVEKEMKQEAPKDEAKEEPKELETATAEPTKLETPERKKRVRKEETVEEATVEEELPFAEEPKKEEVPQEATEEAPTRRRRRRTE